MIDRTIPPEAAEQMPAGTKLAHMATYVCPFHDQFTGAVMLVRDQRYIPFSWLCILDVWDGEEVKRERMDQLDNEFLALMQFESTLCEVVLIVNRLATDHVIKVQQLN